MNDVIVTFVYSSFFFLLLGIVSPGVIKLVFLSVQHVHSCILKFFDLSEVSKPWFFLSTLYKCYNKLTRT